MRIRTIFVSMLILAFSVVLTPAQDDTCAAYVQEALTATDQACTDIGRNTVCYGNVQISASLTDNALSFEQAGDVVGVAAIDTITLAPLNLDNNTWGVALASVQASIPGSLPGQSVTMILFGDAELSPADDNMSAFTFRGGVGSPDCSDAPNGLLVQTPEGVANVTFTVNGLDVSMGSTAFITAAPDEDMLFALLEGEASVGVGDNTQTIAGGEFSTVSLDENLTANDAPTEPEPIVYGEDGIVLPSVLNINNALMPTEVEVELPEGATGNGDAATTSSSGGLIQPLDGQWTTDLGTITAPGCPPMMAEAITQQGIGMNTTGALTFETPFTAQAFFSVMEMEGGMAMSYSNPETNVYTATANVEGGQLDFVLTVISEEEMRMDFTMNMGAVGCTINVPYTLRRLSD